MASVGKNFFIIYFFFTLTYFDYISLLNSLSKNFNVHILKCNHYSKPIGTYITSSNLLEMKLIIYSNEEKLDTENKCDKLLQIYVNICLWDGLFLD